MITPSSIRRALVVAGGVAALTLAAGPAGAQFSGTSKFDKTKIDKSGQDANLKGHALPPIATAADKLPLDKIKLPQGFKVEVWSSGHPAARTMVMGTKGTMFMGTRTIGRFFVSTAGLAADIR